MDKQIIKSLIGSNGIILEIGSADGSDTRGLMEIGKVYAFEPEPRNIKILKEIDGLELYEGAVSDEDGFTTFNRSRTNNPEDLRLSGSILKPKNHLINWDWIFFDEEVRVPTITLDTWWYLNKKPTIDFIWCDAQGAEARIIKGGQEALKHTRYLYREYCNDEHYEGQLNLVELSKLLPDFRVKTDFGTDVLFERI